MGLSGLLNVGLDGPASEVAPGPGSFGGPSAGASKLLIWMSTVAWTVVGGQLGTGWGAALGSGEGGVKGNVTSDMAGEGGSPSTDAAGRGSASPEGFSLLMFSEARVRVSLKGVASPGVVAWLVSVS